MPHQNITFKYVPQFIAPQPPSGGDSQTSGVEQPGSPHSVIITNGIRLKTATANATLPTTLLTPGWIRLYVNKVIKSQLGYILAVGYELMHDSPCSSMRSDLKQPVDTTLHPPCPPYMRMSSQGKHAIYSPETSVCEV